VTNHNTRQERRRYLRMCPKGTVIVRTSTYIIRGRISNLSAGGLSAITRTTPPERLLRSQAEIDLRLDGRDASWLHLQGQILRIGATSIALRFDVVPPSFARIMDETVSASHHHDRLLSVVLVDARPERRSAMTEAFRTAGCTVVDVSTPLEAIVRLGELHFEPHLVAIADSLPATTSEELRRFVDAEHPRTKLVAIGSATSAPAGLALWLSAANPADDLAARIRTVLTTPDRR
jgi:CheY-like chemotaxis protein